MEEEAGAFCEGLRRGLFAGDELKGSFSVSRSNGETHSDATVGAEGDFGEVVDGDGTGGDEDGGGLGEFVEEGEEFEFDLEVVGEGVDDEVGGADGGVDGLGEGQIGKCGGRDQRRGRTRSRRIGLVLRTWGAGVLRPYSGVEIDRCCLQAGVGDVVEDYVEAGAECSRGDLLRDRGGADQGDCCGAFDCVGERTRIGWWDFGGHADGLGGELFEGGFVVAEDDLGAEDGDGAAD